MRDPRIPISYAQAINEAIAQAMTSDSSVICYGLGSTDPKGIFGTTLGLEAAFGSSRVFDVPCSENGMTGVGIGAALGGLRPVMTHQRLDFFLLAMDQLVNAAAKWHYMFGNQCSVPITIRLIIGRGWGQGPTHSQNLQAWFAHVPGLKVVMPTTAYEAKGLLLSSIFDPNPVIFLEHRWLHNATAEVPTTNYKLPLGKATVARSGSDITILSMSYLTVEALRAAEYLLEHYGVSCEVVDLLSLRPLDWDTIVQSLQKTRSLLVLDTGQTTGSIAGEILARSVGEIRIDFKRIPKRLAMPDYPEPTSFGLTDDLYVDAGHIAKAVLEQLDINPKCDLRQLKPQSPHDVPGPWFKGPF